jgi:ABC-type nitrate/sulfonate/bicarbonate transport system substrate-binding protein
VARFVAAMAEGMQFYRNNANKDDAMRILAKYLRVPLDKQRAMIEEGYETYREMLLKKPYADPNGMKTLLEIIAESNPKARSVNLASLVDSSFVERLEREGAFDR